MHKRPDRFLGSAFAAAKRNDHERRRSQGEMEFFHI
jgi:hypothetical protein